MRSDWTFKLLLLGMAATLGPACSNDSSSGGAVAPLTPSGPPGSIGSISRSPVPIGSAYTITGTGLASTSSVQIGGVAQAFTVINDTTISVIVVDDTTPVGAHDLVVSSGGPLSAPLPITVVEDVGDVGVPVTSESVQITSYGPDNKHHMFGYIGHGLTMAWNRSGRYILCLRVDNYKAAPTAGVTAEVAIIDTQNDYEVTVVDTTRAWNLQQGTMFNWNPAAPETQFFFNDSDATGATWTVLFDITAMTRVKEYKFGGTTGVPDDVANGGVAPDGSYFVGINYGRLTLRTGTMIAYADSKPPGGDALLTDGLWKVDIATGNAELIVTLGDILQLHGDTGGTSIYVHHTLVNRDSNRISFITRNSGLNAAAVVNTDGAHNLRVIERANPYHPEWFDESLIPNPGSNGKYDLYDVDLTPPAYTNPLTHVGVDNTFDQGSMDDDNAYGPLGKWYTCSRQLRSPSRWVYQCYRFSDDFVFTATSDLTRGDRTGGTTRIDGAPRWNRLGNELLVGGVVEAAGPDQGTRQLAIIRFVKEP